jgi:hypothetical protein
VQSQGDATEHHLRKGGTISVTAATLAAPIAALARWAHVARAQEGSRAAGLMKPADSRAHVFSQRSTCQAGHRISNA